MKTWAIAKATIGEAARKRSLLLTLALSLVVITALGLFAKYVGGRAMTVAKFAQLEASLRTISLFGAILTILVTMYAIPAELERRTVHTLLSKPLERYQFVLGKFVGCLLLVAMNIALMAIAAFALLMKDSPDLSRGLAQSLAVLMVSFTALCALTIAFSTFVPPMPAGLLAFGLYEIGKVPGLFRQMAEAEGLPPVLRAVSKGVYAAIPYLTPRVNRLNFEAPVLTVAGQGEAVLYVLLYSAACVVIALAIFSRKEL